MLVKKYGNRRLYDTESSRYITLDELSQRIQAGADPKILDARTGEDKTQATLAQIILESRGASRLLPVPLLKQLIRMGDDALAEFFSHYVSWSLEIYVEWKKGAQLFMPPNFLSPLGLLPQWPLLRLLMSSPLFSAPPNQAASPPQPRPPAHVADAKEDEDEPGEEALAGESLPMDELASLRREVNRLKRIVGRGRRRRLK